MRHFDNHVAQEKRVFESTEFHQILVSLKLELIVLEGTIAGSMVDFAISPLAPDHLLLRQRHWPYSHKYS